MVKSWEKSDDKWGKLRTGSFCKLDKNIIQPLEEEWKFVEVEKIGRSRYVKITEAGSNAAEFLI